jgi:N-acetylglucosamine kinase-like BadF-type ATPase
MAHYLCIDGGGTKTSAVLAFVPHDASSADDAIVVRGEAGPSNL